MSDLSFNERSKLESQFEMGGGYVLDFSNRTFREFVVESTGRDIYDPKYSTLGSSKANHLRAFWKTEPNHVVGKLIADLLEYCSPPGGQPVDPVFEACHKIAQKLQQGAPVEEFDALVPDGAGRDFEVVARAVRDAIERNELEAGLDRLHTFVLKFMRVVCAERGIDTGRDKPLHSLVGEYVKRLREAGLIESEMTERILKSSIGTMEAFNHVRNEQSLAHDNPILNYDESLLIFNHVCSAIRFIKALEARPQFADATETPTRDDIPF
jgi:hypothetical protein